MATVSEINTLADDAAAAIAAGDYATAVNKLRGAQVLLAAIPDQIQEQTELRWDRRAIEAAIATCQGAAAQAGGVVRRKYRYVRPTC